jgi:hypothetical protein
LYGYSMKKAKARLFLSVATTYSTSSGLEKPGKAHAENQV